VSDNLPIVELAKESPAAAALVGQLVMANYNDYAAASQQLIQNLQLTLAEREAELELIKERVEELSAKPWAPSTNALLAAIFVTRNEIKARVYDRSEVSS
jgi:hypothetical protein